MKKEIIGFKQVYNNLFRKAWYKLGFKPSYVRVFDLNKSVVYGFVVTPENLLERLDELRQYYRTDRHVQAILRPSREKMLS